LLSSRGWNQTTAKVAGLLDCTVTMLLKFQCYFQSTLPLLQMKMTGAFNSLIRIILDIMLLIIWFAWSQLDTLVIHSVNHAQVKIHSSGPGLDCNWMSDPRVVLHVTIAYVTSSWHNDYCRVIHVPSIRHIYIYTYRSYVHNVGALKVANLHCSRQQCVVVEWSGRSVAVRVRARVREWNFCLLFFSLCESVRKKFVMARYIYDVLMVRE